MNALQVPQCRSCQRYDEDLDKDGVCIECEDKLHEIENDFYDDWDAYMNTRIDDDEEEFNHLETNWTPMDDDWYPESSELCWGDYHDEYDEVDH